jgi:STE24 endopeptidase
VAPVDGLFPAEQVERASRYHRPLYAAVAAATALDLLLFGLLSFTGVGDRLYGAVSGGSWRAGTVGYAAMVLAIASLVGLPLAFWTGYLHEHAWGFSTQSLTGWLLDRCKAFALGLVFGAIAILGLIGAARLSPTWWPLLAAAAAAALILALGVLAPVLLEPLFNRFRPLTDQQLSSRLRQLASQAGVPIERVLVADASRRTSKANAYVSGLGRTRRIVLYDTLVDDTGGPEIELVVAHELGHRKHHDPAKLTLLAIAGTSIYILITWAFLHWAALLAAIDASGPDDPRITPFLLFLTTALGLLASPPGAALSRHLERQADAFSLKLTNDPATFESIHRRLALSNLVDLAPPRLAYLTWFSHPTPAERIATAREHPRAAAQDRHCGECLG